MELNKYSDIKVSLIKSDDNYLDILSLAANITMKKDFKDFNKDKIHKTIKFMLDADHTSVFEHINYTFLIEGASRSYLAQQTRHRIASYTSGSQHYQNYEDYSANVIDSLDPQLKKLYKESIERSIDDYKMLMELGMKKYEARQVLPNGMQNNLMITINARSLINLFRLRLCYRATEEIRVVTTKMYNLCLNHFPELFQYIGPPCVMSNKCNQGKMTCGFTKAHIEKDLELPKQKD